MKKIKIKQIMIIITQTKTILQLVLACTSYCQYLIPDHMFVFFFSFSSEQHNMA